MVYRKYEEDEKARFHIVTPKTSAGVRIVPMLSEVKAALQAEWETQKIVGFNESVVDGYTGFIFQNRYGDPLSPHSVNRAIDRICAAYIEDEICYEPMVQNHAAVFGILPLPPSLI